MKLFTQPQTVKVPADIVEKAKDFAKRVAATTDYSDSNQYSKTKISNDHLISKIGEEAVKIVFQGLGKTVIDPDYGIYEAKQKSWREDLTIDTIPMAVKTQKRSAASIYGLSWTFQCSATRTDPILQKPEAWVCFVEYNDRHGYECIVYPPCQIKELTFKEPKKEELKHMKKVVYAEDLPIYK
ncbi:MAG: hypothetical protein KIT80_07045 [Chitinophagaceae bacterium]|nr:hypothetical protein [Chitinophagaceae bacterium]MCW5926655.1 hypothetical protein [Chitinophagaceae bacterium]